MSSLVGTRRGSRVGVVIGSAIPGVDTYPVSSAHVAALTGITPTTIYAFRTTSGAVTDELGGTSLSANGSPTYQAQVGDSIGVTYDSAAAGHRADVNGMGLASWLYAVIFRAPQTTAAALPGVIGRFDAAATVGAGLYLQTTGSTTMLVKDGVGALTVSGPAGTVIPGDLYLAQIQIDRAANLARARWSRIYGIRSAYADSGSIAGFLTLSTVGQTFGVGSYVAPVTYGIGASWAMTATGAQVEGANVLANFAAAIGAE